MQEKSPKARDEIQRLQYWHRFTFMSERTQYYSRRNECETDPENFLSTIGDGMQQAHNDLPWYANSGKQLCKSTLGTALDGLLVHGTPTAAMRNANRKSRISIYRHFANIPKTPNMAIYCWLNELEYEKRERNKLPPVLYHQFDGGCENANKLFVAIAEWLVLKGMTEKVVLTRLPVGHTHEDIDAQFAHIWRALQSQYVQTPEAQRIFAMKGLGQTKEVVWKDVWCVPDFAAFFTGHLAKCARGFKSGDEDWTQLQWTVQSRPDGKCTTTYRAYSSKEV